MLAWLRLAWRSRFWTVATAELEAQGQFLAVESLLVGQPQGIADRLVDGARHDVSLFWALPGVDRSPYPIPRKTWCPDLAQNLLSGNRAACLLRRGGRPPGLPGCRGQTPGLPPRQPTSEPVVAMVTKPAREGSRGPGGCS